MTEHLREMAECSGLDGLVRGGWQFLSSTVGEITIDLLREHRLSRSTFSRIDVDTPFIMPANVAGLEDVLEHISKREDIGIRVRRRLAKDVIANFCSAISAGRATDKVTVLLLGGTKQGKSQTINKLIGRREFLKTGRHQSTTKDIDSVTVPAIHDGISVDLTFDDTPGLLDTNDADRTKNALTLSRYTRSFSTTSNSTNVNDLTRLLDVIYSNGLGSTLNVILRTEVFPNVVLITGKWDCVTKDDNPVNRLTSPLGHAIRAVQASDLYDRKRPNVIVVVTGSLTDPTGYLDEDKGTVEFDLKWEEEARLKRQFIHAIQSKIFPNSNPWPIAFVENGGKPREFPTYEILPTGERSHQNLFDTMKDLFSYRSRHGIQDLLGLHSLTNVASGCVEGDARVRTSVLVQEDEDVSEAEKRLAMLRLGEHPDPTNMTSVAVGKLAIAIVGHAYNPIQNEVGPASLVDFQDMPAITHSTSMDFRNVSKTSLYSSGDGRNNKQLGFDFYPPPTQASKNSWSQFTADMIVASAKLDCPMLSLTPEVAETINALPPWDKESQDIQLSYLNFFNQHGTHIILSAALGGTIQLVSSEGAGLHIGDVECALQTGALRSPPYSLQDPACDPYSDEAQYGQQIQFGSEGGRQARPSLLDSIHKVFYPAPGATTTSEDWASAKAQWANELMNEPIFLPSADDTIYKWVHEATGLSQERQQYLKDASHWYLTRGQARHADLPRVENAREAGRTLREGQHVFWSWIADTSCVIQ